MATEERPNKLRKLESLGQDMPEVEATAPLLQQQDENVTSDPENSKPHEHTANNADATGPGSGNAPVAQVPSKSQIEGPIAPPQNGEPTPTMSKSQMKKQRKQQEWEAGRDYRKAKRKQKIQEKRQRKRETREEAESQQQQNGVSKPQHGPRPRPVLLPITILIDCGFDDLMTEKERISLGSQLTRSYSDTWRAPFQTHLVLSSWGGLLKERFDTVLRKHYLNWKGVTFESGDFVEAAQKANQVMRGPNGGNLAGIFQSTAGPRAAEEVNVKQPQHSTDAASPPPTPQNGTASSPPTSITSTNNVDSGQHQPVQPPHPDSSPTSQPTPDDGETIYLTSDSPNTLTTLRPYSTYIVGGLVDKNRHKGICYRTACDRGIKTAKLPIGEYLEMQSRKVLTTNHVVEIMIRYLECGDWGEAFLKVIPKRKGGKLRGEKKDEDEVVDGSEEEDDDAEENDDAHGEDNISVDEDHPSTNGEVREISAEEVETNTSNAEVSATLL